METVNFDDVTSMTAYIDGSLYTNVMVNSCRLIPDMRDIVDFCSTIMQLSIGPYHVTNVIVAQGCDF